jgi:NADPH2:quinone reductase
VGQKVLIHAGAGGVGHVAIQLAKLRGAEVCTTVGSPDKARLARQLGADYTILYRQTDWVQAVLDWTGGQGVDLAFDTVGGQTFFASCRVVRVYGDLVTILEPDLSLGNLKVARNRNLRLSLELMLSPALMGLVEPQQHQTDILQQCASWIDEGKLEIHLSETFPLKDAAVAHRAIETGSTTGKIALLIV